MSSISQTQLTNMEANSALLLPKPLLGLSSSPLPTKQIFLKKSFGSKPRSKTLIFALSNLNSPAKPADNNDNRKKINGVELFATTSLKGNARKGQETTSVAVNPQPYAPPPPSQFGSPLFWIGVGVGFSALFSFVTGRVTKYAMQQYLKTMMGQNNQYSNAGFSPGSPFGFPPSSTSGSSPSPGFPYQSPSASWQGTSHGYTYPPSSTVEPNTSIESSASSGSDQTSSASSAASKAAATANVSTTQFEAVESLAVKDETEVKTEAKQSAFVDVSPEDGLGKTPFEDFNGSSSSQKTSVDAKFAEVVQNGAPSKEGTNAKEVITSEQSQSTRKTSSVLSVEALEKMMEDPSVQTLIYPHLPEEMRNPTTFKWMLQNPVYRQQLQEMLDNMGGNRDWDKQMVDTLKNVNFDSPEVKQQFDQLGLTPEEAISRILANPDLALGFQNPRVQQAVLDLSQNPLNLMKYQNDEEVMSVLNKISQLFPGAGPGGF